MPLYMDIHRNLKATVDDVQAAHMSDLEAQARHGVKYLKYWFNPTAGTVCCLVNAPDPEAAEAVHVEAHGLVPDKIVEVQSDVVEAFLGGSVDAGLGRMVTRQGDPDGGFRAVLFTDLVGSTDLTQRLGDDRAMEVLKAHDGIIRREVDAHHGEVIKHTGDGIMAAFPDVSSAIRTAIATQRAFRVHNERVPDTPIQVRIGIAAGEPVDDGKDLFGLTVQLARRICDAAGGETVWVSNVVRELCLGKPFGFEEVGPTMLKGFPDTLQLHRVIWS
jgi:class 3 adenylate cyclase